MQKLNNHSENMMQLVSRACLAPSSFNLQHTRYAVVTQADKLRSIHQYLHDFYLQDFQEIDINLCEEGLDGFIGIFAVQSPWEAADEYAAHLSQEFQETSKKKAYMVYENHDQVQRDEMFRSAGLAIQTILWSAGQFGYGVHLLDQMPPALIDNLKSQSQESLTWVAGLLIDHRLPHFNVDLTSGQMLSVEEA